MQRPHPGRNRRLIPLRIEDVPAARMPAVLPPLLYRDLFGMPADRARQVLLDSVTGPRRPGQEPVFPVSESGPVTPINTATNTAGKAIKVGLFHVAIAITP